MVLQFLSIFHKNYKSYLADWALPFGIYMKPGVEKYSNKDIHQRHLV